MNDAARETWNQPALRTLRVSLDTAELGGSNADGQTGTTIVA
jgi:hypothetical protein